MTARAVRYESLVAIGVLPRAGGWLDQDPLDILLIEAALDAKSAKIKANADR